MSAAPRPRFTEADAKALLARLISNPPASTGMRSLAQLLEGR